MKKFVLLFTSLLALTITGCSSNDKKEEKKDETTSFSVSLQNSETTQLALSEHSSFEEKKSSIVINGLIPLEENTYTGLPSLEELDNENKTYLDYKNKRDNLTLFKHTFFIKNEGDTPVNYAVNFNIVRDIKSDDGRSLSDTVRVMIFDNDASSEEHMNFIFAKKSESMNPLYDENGQPTGGNTDMEYISVPPNSGKPFPGYAQTFSSDKVVNSFNEYEVAPEKIKRYTMVVWLEGEDPQSQGSSPAGSLLEFGVTIEEKQ